MAQVIVRDIDDEVVSTLKCKAELHGCSLEQELRDILSDAARLTGDERVALARCIRAMTPSGITQTDSTAIIREQRDTRRS